MLEHAIQAAGVIGIALLAVAATPAIRITRVGGIRFIRIGRVQLSVCVCRATIPANDNQGPCDAARGLDG